MKLEQASLINAHVFLDFSDDTDYLKLLKYFQGLDSVISWNALIDHFNLAIYVKFENKHMLQMFIEEEIIGNSDIQKHEIFIMNTDNDKYVHHKSCFNQLKLNPNNFSSFLLLELEDGAYGEISNKLLSFNKTLYFEAIHATHDIILLIQDVDYDEMAKYTYENIGTLNNVLRAKHFRIVDLYF